LGGTPNLNPAEVANRSATQVREGETLVDMIKENLVAERIAVETYREMIRYFAEKRSDDAVIMERVLAQGREHANDHARSSRRPRGPADARALTGRRGSGLPFSNGAERLD